jgi:hypothetical protein
MLDSVSELIHSLLPVFTFIALGASLVTVGILLHYWLVVLLGAVYTLARFSEAFLVLRTQDVGLELGYVPLAMMVMNILYAGIAYPAGAAADHMSQRILLLLCYGYAGTTGDQGR